MRKLKRSVTLAVVLFFGIAAVALASGDQDSGSEGGKPVPIRFLTNGDSGAPWVTGAQDDRIFQEINDTLGIELKVDAYKQSQWEKVNVAIASGDMPDVVTNTFPSPAVYQWIRDGVLVPLNDYWQYMPTVKEKCESESWTAFDGKYYGYPFVTGKGTTNWSFIIRGDWLEAVGMEWPETLDDFWKLGEAFIEDDPDGNGKADVLLWGGPGYMVLMEAP